MQFPLPIVHSHEQLAQLNPQAWQEHLQLHHTTDSSESPCGGALGLHDVDDEDLHWHWVLPWELASYHTPLSLEADFSLGYSPCGLYWAPSVSFQTVQAVITPSLDWSSPEPLRPAWGMSALDSRHIALGAMPPYPSLRSATNSAFVHRFLGIPVRHWLAVYLT